MFLIETAAAADVFEDHAFYYGDPHVHTGASGDGGSSDLGTCDGTCGAVADLVSIAHLNGLDWMVVLDHVNGGSTESSDDFERLRDLLLAANDPDGGFVTVLGAEVWARDPLLGDLGHRSLFFFGDDLAAVTLVDTQPRFDSAGVECAELDPWMAGLEERFGNTLLIPHHPSATIPMATNWECFNAHFEPAVEMYSAHGNALWDGTPQDPTVQGSTVEGTVHYAMDPDGLARRLGFLGGTDTHDTLAGGVCDRDTEKPEHPYAGGLTVVVLDEGARFDRAAIYDAIVGRRTYATTGPRIPVVIGWESGGADLGGLGADVGVPEGQGLDVTVQVSEPGAASVTRVDLILPDTSGIPMTDAGGGRWITTVPTDQIPAWLYAAVAVDGDDFYAAAGCDDGGDTADEWLWLSPSFFTRVPGDLDGDGVSYLDGDCDDGDAAVIRCGEDTGVDTGVDSGGRPDSGAADDSAPTPPGAGTRCGCTSGTPIDAGGMLIGAAALLRARRRDRPPRR